MFFFEVFHQKKKKKNGNEFLIKQKQKKKKSESIFIIDLSLFRENENVKSRFYKKFTH